MEFYQRAQRNKHLFVIEVLVVAVVLEYVILKVFLIFCPQQGGHNIINTSI